MSRGYKLIIVCLIYKILEINMRESPKWTTNWKKQVCFSNTLHAVSRRAEVDVGKTDLSKSSRTPGIPSHIFRLASNDHLISSAWRNSRMLLTITQCLMVEDFTYLRTTISFEAKRTSANQSFASALTRARILVCGSRSNGPTRVSRNGSLAGRNRSQITLEHPCSLCQNRKKINFFFYPLANR